MGLLLQGKGYVSAPVSQAARVLDAASGKKFQINDFID
jgi:hypothetical protein